MPLTKYTSDTSGFKVGDRVTFKDIEENRKAKAYKEFIGKIFTIDQICSTFIYCTGIHGGAFPYRFQLVPAVILDENYSID